MIPLTQTRTVPPGLTREERRAIPPRETGNCWAACIASILELPLDEVDAGILLDPDEWFENTRAYLKTIGWTIAWLQDGPPKGWSIAGGMSPRGIPHGCVALDGDVVHDPHPDRTGLEKITDWFLLVRLA